MLSSGEARAKMNKSVSKRVANELAVIEEKINHAIDRGESYIAGTENFHKQTVKELEKLGYKVTFGNQYNELFFKISWE